MIVLMRCVAEAVVANGVKGLTGLVPGGAFLYEVATDSLRRLREERRAAALREEVLSAATATFEEARAAAAAVSEEVGAGLPAEDKAALEMYLTQIPGAVRQSLKRADDPSGRSVPANFGLSDPADLARRLPAHAARLRPGDALPGRAGWRVTELLGTGGFGEVWLARNPALAALKGAVKFGLDPQARERLLRHEGSLVSRVMEAGRHPNVVPLMDAHLEGNAPWLMYEYVGGGDLTGLLLGWQSLPPADRVARAVEALRTLAAAVGHFHRLPHPIVHRDLKPANILVAAGGAAPELKVADFGIGGVAADAALARETQRHGSTGVIGSQLWGSHTPLYASPQQQRGEKPDPRDDVHALGVIGYQMLTGKLDHAPGADFAKTLRRLGVPDPLVELVGDCAAHDPDNRPKDGAELAERLKAPGSKPTPATTGETTRVACPACAAGLRVPVGKLAKSVTCPKCAHKFVPVEPAAPPPQTRPAVSGSYPAPVPQVYAPYSHAPAPPHPLPLPPPAATASPWESLPADPEPAGPRPRRGRGPQPRSRGGRWVWVVGLLAVPAGLLTLYFAISVVVAVLRPPAPRADPYTSYPGVGYNVTPAAADPPAPKADPPLDNVFTGLVSPQQPKAHAVTVAAGRAVEAVVRGDPGAKLALSVYGPGNVLLGEDIGLDASAAVTITTRAAGVYVVVVSNTGRAASAYRLEIREASSSR